MTSHRSRPGRPRFASEVDTAAPDTDPDSTTQSAGAARPPVATQAAGVRANVQPHAAHRLLNAGEPAMIARPPEGEPVQRPPREYNHIPVLWYWTCLCHSSPKEARFGEQWSRPSLSTVS